MVESISKIVKTLIERDISLKEAIHKDYGNYSAIARMLKPKIDETAKRKVNLESVITAIKRVKVTYTSEHENTIKVIARSVINIRTDVAKISIEKTRKNLEVVRKSIANLSEEFVHVIEGTSAITLIFDQKLFDDISFLFSNEEILDKKQNLAEIIIRSPTGLIGTHGCLLTFVNSLSRRGMNIEEIMSCYTDTIIALSMKNVGEAFSALTNLISDAREELSNL
jgi:hypothetical protein